jgi:nicotinamide riboside kinase
MTAAPAPIATTIINLFGGPGCGKSTLAADVFVALKRANISVELVREYVKDWAWRGDKIGEWDQLYLIAKQLRRESCLYGKVAYVITDSPIVLAGVYERLYQPESFVGRNTIAAIQRRQLERGLRSVDLIVRREKPYVAAGRYETADMAQHVDGLCADLPGPRTPRVGSGAEVLAVVIP